MKKNFHRSRVGRNQSKLEGTLSWRLLTHSTFMQKKCDKIKQVGVVVKLTSFETAFIKQVAVVVKLT